MLQQVDKTQVLSDAKRALLEDVGSGDVTALLIPAGLLVEAQIISREPLLVCGTAWVNAVFECVNPDISLQWNVVDGQWCPTPLCLCKIRGKARDILTAERVALNFLQTLSGTATITRSYVSAIAHTRTKLLDTRKTIPGMRYAQKYAVRCGGGTNHRMGLYDAFLIKENHITACGSVTLAIQQARKLNKDLLLEVEVETLSQLQEALNAMPDRILLDNFSRQDLQKAVRLNNSQVALEVSGGVNLLNIKEIAEIGVDYISVGAITKSLQAIDLSLLIQPGRP